MSRWFRYYDGTLDDPKVQRLDPVAFRAWVNLLCLASRNEGRLPAREDIEFALRVEGKAADAMLKTLTDRGLLDEVDGILRPHNWDGRQHVSDVSTNRVKAFRERKAKQGETVSETPPDTEQNRADQKDSRPVAKATTAPREPGRFEEFWKAYPQREGSNPKAPAAKKFALLVRSGVPQQVLIDAAKRCAIEYAKEGSAGTKFVPQAITWLNQQRFGDYGGGEIKEFKAFPVTPGTDEWRAWEAYHGARLNALGKSYALQQMKAAAEDRKPYQAVSQWPPGHEPTEPPESNT